MQNEYPTLASISSYLGNFQGCREACESAATSLPSQGLLLVVKRPSKGKGLIALLHNSKES